MSRESINRKITKQRGIPMPSDPRGMRKKKNRKHEKAVRAKARKASAEVTAQATRTGIYWLDEDSKVTIYSMKRGEIIAFWWKARRLLELTAGHSTVPCSLQEAKEMLSYGGRLEGGIISQPAPQPAICPFQIRQDIPPQ